MRLKSRNLRTIIRDYHGELTYAAAIGYKNRPVRHVCPASRIRKKSRIACQEWPVCGGVCIGKRGSWSPLISIFMGTSFTMIGRETRLLIGGIVGLLLALACTTAEAAIILDRDALALAAGQFQDLGLATADDAAGSAGAPGAADTTAPTEPAAPSSPNEGQAPLPLIQPDGLGPASGSAGHPSTVSPPGAGASGATAILSQVFDLPHLALQTRLPRESSPYLPTGPPFELLRPPRSGQPM